MKARFGEKFKNVWMGRIGKRRLSMNEVKQMLKDVAWRQIEVDEG